MSAGYISARDGKWHRAIVAQPAFTRYETAACGRSFRPLNVTWDGEMPPTLPGGICKQCEARGERADR